MQQKQKSQYLGLFQQFFIKPFLNQYLVKEAPTVFTFVPEKLFMIFKNLYLVILHLRVLQCRLCVHRDAFEFGFLILQYNYTHFYMRN